MMSRYLVTGFVVMVLGALIPHLSDEPEWTTRFLCLLSLAILVTSLVGAVGATRRK